MEKIKVMTLFGTRPEAVKMAPLVKELEKCDVIESIVCVTAQHREMLDQVLEAFDVNPDYDLSIMKDKQTLFDITTNILNRIKEVLEEVKPDVVLVHGDTSTTFTTALACFYMQIPVGHVEAGLRTYNIYSPYPEEFNRQAVSIISQFNFAPTEVSKGNLLREGRAEDTIYVTGNTEHTAYIHNRTSNLTVGSLQNFLDDYLKNSDEKQLGKLMDFLRGQKEGNDRLHTAESVRTSANLDGLIEKVGLFAMEKQSISVDAIKENFSIGSEQAENLIKQLETIGFIGAKEADGNHKVIMDKEAFLNRIQGYQELADRMRAVASSKNMDLSDVTISKTLIVEENDRAVKTRVPGTYGENARYLWIDKENAMDIHNGKTMLTFIDNNKNYKLYDAENRVVETKSGDNLYTHYDKVESSVRERYEKSQKETKTKTPTKQASARKPR